MVVTSAFHQLRSFLTFRCAVRQSLPPEQRMKVCRWSTFTVPLSKQSMACGTAGQKSQQAAPFLTCAEQVWVAHVPVEGLQLDGLRLQRVFSAWDFWRELAAIGYYFGRGWLC